MDDLYAINTARTRFREAIIAADLDAMTALIRPDFTEACFGQPSVYGEDTRPAFRAKWKATFDQYHAEMAYKSVEIVVSGDMAYDWGYYTLTLAPHAGGHPTKKNRRFLFIWRKKDDEWKAGFYMTSSA